MYRRDELITSVDIAVDRVLSGRHTFHEKTILSAAQMKTWTLAKYIEKVREKKLYVAREVM